MSSVMEDLVSALIEKGVERIGNRKNLTSQDLTVLLLHQQSRSLARMEKGMERLEKGVDGLVAELREFRQEFVPILSQASDIADIKARMARIEAKLN